MSTKIRINLKFDFVKKVFIIIIFSFASSNVFSQNCQAMFDAILYPSNQTLALRDQSYRLDSLSVPLNVTEWHWTITTPVSTIIDSVQNPVIPISLSWDSVYVCLDIVSDVNGSVCLNSYCNTVYFSYIPTYFCNTNFTYNINLATNTVSFAGSTVDQFGSPLNVINYQWNFANGNPLTSNIQNPQSVFPGPGKYNVCLVTTTDTGCISTYCDSIQIIDTTNCGPNVGANIGHVTVPHGHDGYIEMIVSGGTPPYNYIWTNLVSTGPNAYNLSSGAYTVTISDANTLCPAAFYTYHLLEPYDPLVTIVDTLTTNIIDTCFGFVPDSFYVASLAVSGNTVYLDWVFSKNALTFNLTVAYAFTYYGAQMVFVTIDCNGTKNRTNYISYINIRQTSVEENNSNEESIIVFPNPIWDFLNIEFKGRSSLENTISIYNNNGQIVMKKQVNNQTNSISINASSLPKGIYFVTVENSEGNTITKKIIK